MIDGVRKIKDDLLPMEDDDFDMMEDDLVMTEDDQNLLFPLIELGPSDVWIHLNVLKWLGLWR